MARPESARPEGHKLNPAKMPRFPKNARIQRRPILHPAIPSPYTNASQQKVVYVRANTPFISAVKRVRKLLDGVEKRATGQIELVNGKGSDKQKLKQLSDKMAHGKKKQSEVVVMKATGRAIEKLLSLALFFQGQPDCVIRLRTGTVGVVDDIVEVEEDDAGGENEEVEELPESRIRKISFVEVAITLK